MSKKGSTFSLTEIKSWAKQHYEWLKNHPNSTLKDALNDEEMKETFKASNGWWQRFSNRYGINMKKYLEQIGSAKKMATGKNPKKSKKIL